MRFINIIILILLSTNICAQVYEFDLLELKYNQGHYKHVIRKSNRLMDNPENDYSFVPNYYRSMSTLQLMPNAKFKKRNKKKIDESVKFLLSLNNTNEGRQFLKSHMYEMSALKSDLKQWASILKIDENQKTFDEVLKIINVLFAETPNIETLDVKEKTNLPLEEKTEKKPIVKEVVEAETKMDQRTALLFTAEQYLGIPYKWAGTTPKGFDCSGFTYYLMQSINGIELDRRSADQFKNAKKVRERNVKPGDLVFFDSGKGISHVGIVIEKTKDELWMIHSSTSVGISKVEIYSSKYWNKRLAGFGTYFND